MLFLFSFYILCSTAKKLQYIDFINVKIKKVFNFL